MLFADQKSLATFEHSQTCLAAISKSLLSVEVGVVRKASCSARTKK
jgi:hypothetical protein